MIRAPEWFDAIVENAVLSAANGELPPVDIGRAADLLAEALHERGIDLTPRASDSEATP